VRPGIALRALRRLGPVPGRVRLDAARRHGYQRRAYSGAAFGSSSGVSSDEWTIPAVMDPAAQDQDVGVE
jgi:hypothetical protein